MIIRTLLLVTLLTSGMLSAVQAEPIIGADISHLPQLEAAGATFFTWALLTALYSSPGLGFVIFSSYGVPGITRCPMAWAV